MGDFTTKRVSIDLTGKELSFLKWLAKRDSCKNVNEELGLLLKLQIREEMELYEDEALRNTTIGKDILKRRCYDC